MLIILVATFVALLLGENDYLIKALKSSPDIDIYISKPPRMTITTDGKRIQDLKPDTIIAHKINKDDLIKHAFIEYSRHFTADGSSFSHFVLNSPKNSKAFFLDEA